MTGVMKEMARRIVDSSPEVRRRAVRELATLPVNDSIDLILVALADDDWRVRKETVSVLSDMPCKSDVVGQLLDALVQNDNVGLRNAAAEALATMGADAVTMLSDRMGSLGAQDRKIALEVIGRSGDPRSGGMLISHLKDPDANVRVCTAELLGEQGGGEALDALMECVDKSDYLLTLAALQSLNKLGARIPWQKLEDLSDDPILGSEILFAMGRSAQPAAASIIVKSVPDEPAAVRSLELLHGASPETAEAVEQALKNADEAVHEALDAIVSQEETIDQRAAVRCLMWSRRIESLPLLVGLVSDETMHRVIVEGLSDWGYPAFAALEEMLPTLDGRPLASVVGLLARTLDEEQGKSKAALFMAYLHSSNIAVATAAVGAIARFGNEGMIPRLIELSGFEDQRVRRAAGHALVQVGCRAPDAVRDRLLQMEITGLGGIELCRVLEVVGRPQDAGSLASALSSPIPELRRASLSSLAAIAGSAAVNTISLAMTDEDMGVRMAAASALARIGSAAAETIVSAIHTAQGPLKAALVRALGRVGHIEAPAILKGLCRESSEVAMAALEAMRNLELAPGELQYEILNHDDSEVVKKALSFLGSAISGQRIAGLLKHPAWDVRLAAVDRLSCGDYKDPEISVELEARLLDERDDLVRASIEHALGERKGVK